MKWGLEIIVLEFVHQLVKYTFLTFSSLFFCSQGAVADPQAKVSQNLKLTATQLGVGRNIIMKFIICSHNQSAIFALSSPGRTWWRSKCECFIFLLVNFQFFFMWNIWMINNLLIFCNRRVSICQGWKSYVKVSELASPFITELSYDTSHVTIHIHIYVYNSIIYNMLYYIYKYI